MNRQTVARHDSAFYFVAKQYAERGLKISMLKTFDRENFLREVETVRKLNGESLKRLMLSGEATEYGNDKLATAFNDEVKL